MWLRRDVEFAADRVLLDSVCGQMLFVALHVAAELPPQPDYIPDREELPVKPDAIPGLYIMQMGSVIKCARPAQHGDIVRTHFVSSLMNGNVIESSYKSEKFYIARLGFQGACLRAR